MGYPKRMFLRMLWLRKKAAAAEMARAEGKPDNIIDRIVEGRLAKFFEESCLIRQEYIRTMRNGR